jgi:hypothetical protein
LWAPATWLESDTADGAISSTAEDMCCYLRSLLNRGEGLLLKESFEQLIEPIIPTDDGLHGEHYGLGLSIKHVTGNHIISHSGGMVGYMAHMLADLDSGFGVIALSNSPYDPENIANMAWEYLIAAHKRNEIPEVSEVDPYSVKNIEDYAGRFRCGKKEFSLCEQGEHLYLEFQGDSVLLEPISPDIFLVPHPVFELFLLRFERLTSSSSQEIEGRRETKRYEGGTITKALHGSDIYLPEGGSEPPEPEYLPEWDSNWNAYPGHYRSHNPWYPNIRVVLRKGELILIEPSGDEEPLYPLEPGLFRVGADPRSPEFIRFEVLIDGKAMQVNLSGGVYSRTFTP